MRHQLMVLALVVVVGIPIPADARKKLIGRRINCEVGSKWLKSTTRNGNAACRICSCHHEHGWMCYISDKKCQYPNLTALTCQDRKGQVIMDCFTCKCDNTNVLMCDLKEDADESCKPNHSGPGCNVFFDTNNC